MLDLLAFLAFNLVIGSIDYKVIPCNLCMFSMRYMVLWYYGSVVDRKEEEEVCWFQEPVLTCFVSCLYSIGKLLRHEPLQYHVLSCICNIHLFILVSKLFFKIAATCCTRLYWEVIIWKCYALLHTLYFSYCNEIGC